MKWIHCDCSLVKWLSQFLIMFYFHHTYFNIHRNLLLRSLCTSNNRYLVTSDSIKHSFHNFSNINWIRTRWSREKCWNFKWSLRTLKKKKTLDRNPNHYWPIQKNHNVSFTWNWNNWLTRVATSWSYALFELKQFGCRHRRKHRMMHTRR